jgi:UDP-N-acetylglucosamine--N-acetylmuramyl-(pentapeptide) pyrophosphoryl-undecaprenol N-acetylglucosamine transferase
VHVCGEARLAEAERAAAGLPASLRLRYHLFPYLRDEEMAHMLAAADLALCRSGASVLGELPATGTPAVLVPFPDPAVHQRENADSLAKQGAAVVLPEVDLSQLPYVIIPLLDDSSRLQAMAQAARTAFRPDAAAAIAALIEDVA